jgi:hypothetical protein
VGARAKALQIQQRATGPFANMPPGCFAPSASCPTASERLLLSQWVDRGAPFCDAGSSVDAGQFTYDAGNRDAGPISYVNDIVPIWNARCATAGCHDGAGTTFPNLTGGAATHARIVNAASLCDGGTMGPRVVAGNPPASFLWRKLYGVPATVCGAPMPHGTQGLRLVDGGLTDFYLVEDWILQGAPNN